MDRRTRTPSAQTRYFEKIKARTTLRLKGEVRAGQKIAAERKKQERLAAREAAE